MSVNEFKNNSMDVKKSTLQVLDSDSIHRGYGINLDNGFILTCTHIVLAALGLNKYIKGDLIGRKVKLKRIIGKDNDDFECEIIYADNKIDEEKDLDSFPTDLAILKVVGNEKYDSIHSCSLDNVSGKLKILQELEKEEYAFSNGTFSSTTDSNNNLFTIQSESSDHFPFIKGNSGKPVLNEKGNICGIISTSPNSHNDAFSYCIGLDAFNIFLLEIEKKAFSEIELIESYIEEEKDVILFDLLHLHGRSWIENKTIKDGFIVKLEKIKSSNSCKKSRLWANYLWSLHEMFSNLNAYKKKGYREELFSEQHIKEAVVYNLEELFLAECIEFKRKTEGNTSNVLLLTNILKFILDAHHIRDDKKNLGQEKRYAIATSTFILAKVYKNGGLIKGARNYFEISKKWYVRGILSHDNEIAHCDYMINLLDMLLGNDVSIQEKKENTSFLDGLNMMIKSNQLWMEEKDKEAIEQIELASEVFDAIGYKEYSKKCSLLKTGFECWVSLENEAENAFINDIKGYHVAIEFLATNNKKHEEGFREWFSGQDPIRLLSVLKFSKFSNPDLKMSTFKSKLFFVEKNNELSLAEGNLLSSTSISDAIYQLETHLDLKKDVRRFPLILSG